jgi:rare lipoprotein A
MTTGVARARPLLLSDLPPDIRSLPSAQADLPEVPISPTHGIASWYGHDHAGRRMSNGAVFDPQALTAAHASLPLGTRVRVVRDDTGASVVVTITDRIGTHRRMLDVSHEAAKELGMLGAGIVLVHLAPAQDTDYTFLPTAEPAATEQTQRRRPRQVAHHTPTHRPTQQPAQAASAQRT